MSKQLTAYLKFELNQIPHGILIC